MPLMGALASTVQFLAPAYEACANSGLASNCSFSCLSVPNAGIAGVILTMASSTLQH